MYNDPRRVWLCGYYGMNNLGNTIWMAELSTHNYVASSEDKLSGSKSRLYPNPAKDRFYLQFENPKAQLLNIELYDIRGQLVKKVIRDFVKSGLNELSFSTSGLTSGSYILQVNYDTEILTTKKLVVD